MKDDNRIENLIAMRGSHHKKLIPLLCRRIKDLEDELVRVRQYEVPL